MDNRFTDSPHAPDFRVTAGVVARGQGVTCEVLPGGQVLRVIDDEGHAVETGVRVVRQEGKAYAEVTLSQVLSAPGARRALDGRFDLDRKNIRVHQLAAVVGRGAMLLGSSVGEVGVHHVNLNSGDNRAENLRTVTTPTHNALHRWLDGLPADERAAYLASIPESPDGLGHGVPEDLRAAVARDTAALESGPQPPGQGQEQSEDSPCEVPVLGVLPAEAEPDRDDERPENDGKDGGADGPPEGSDTPACESETDAPAEVQPDPGETGRDDDLGDGLPERLRALVVADQENLEAGPARQTPFPPKSPFPGVPRFTTRTAGEPGGVAPQTATATDDKSQATEAQGEPTTDGVTGEAQAQDTTNDDDEIGATKFEGEPTTDEVPGAAEEAQDNTTADDVPGATEAQEEPQADVGYYPDPEPTSGGDDESATPPNAETVADEYLLAALKVGRPSDADLETNHSVRQKLLDVADVLLCSIIQLLLTGGHTTLSARVINLLVAGMQKKYVFEAGVLYSYDECPRSSRTA
jgi:hypothetical protein